MSDPVTKEGELLPREEEVLPIETPSAEEVEEFRSAEMVLDRLSVMANPRVPRIMNRRVVEQGFLQAFEAIGGTTRLALWANENPGKFYELLTRLFPKEVTNKIQGGLVVQHALSKNNKLDGEG